MKTDELSSSHTMFLGSILQKITSITSQIDTQINIAIAISSAIFVFSATNLYDSARNPLYLLVLAGFSGMSTVFALLAIHPPSFMRKRGQAESIIYHKKIEEHFSPDDYADSLQQAIKDRQATLHEYAREIYNVSKYYYRPKRILFNYSRNLLIVGFILTFIIFMITILQQDNYFSSWAI